MRYAHHHVLLLLALFSSSSAQTLWFQAPFSTSSPHWARASGEWTALDSLLRCETKAYDQLYASTFYALGTAPYSFEVTLRGSRAGVYFHLDDTTHKAFSHMIRFDDQSVLTGYFNGAGEYRATNTFESPVSPIDWLTLRVDVDPIRGRYTVSVNGKVLGVDSMLVYRTGYFGLQVSDCRAEFNPPRVFGLRSQPPPGRTMVGEEVHFQHVRSVWSQRMNVTFYNPETRSLQTTDAEGKLQRDEPMLESPRLKREITVEGKKVSIEDSRVMMRDESGALVDSLVDRLSAPSALLGGTLNGKNVIYIADPGITAVVMCDVHGTVLKEFNASSIGGFRGPLSMDSYGDHELVIADFDRLVFIGTDLEDLSPTIATPSPREAIITWSRVGTLAPSIDFFEKAGIQTSVSPDGARNSAHLTGLEPLHRYSFYLSSVLKTIPQSASYSRLYRLTTPPADSGSMAYTRLPLMYMVYRTISYRDKYPAALFPQVPAGRTLNEAELEYLEDATRFNREFYFRNSSCKLVLDFDFYVVEDTLWLHEVGEQDPYWLNPNERVTRDFERAAAHFGRKPEDYVGLLCPYAWVNYPARRRGIPSNQSQRDSVSIRQAFGGGTYGVPAPWRYGKTAGYTGNPFQDIFSRQDWLITHEFHHQIDALMEGSGFPEYFHCDQPWKMPGRFGEDFDFNAQIMRLSPPSRWLELSFGRLAQTEDADRDGVPDDDSSLPFDEVRMGSNPGLKDSDGDGLSDLAEAMAGTSEGTDPDDRDTDGDGIPDGSDPEPLYEFNGTVKKGFPSTYIGSVRTKDLDADVFAGWDSNYFTIRYEADHPANILMQIDANADGWFHGFDNIQTRVLAYEDSLTTADYYLRDCSSWIVSPPDRRDILRRSDLIVEVEKRGVEVTGRTYIIRGRGLRAQSRSRVDTYVLTVKVPKNPAYGFSLVEGKNFGLRIGLQTQTDLWVWHELYQRNYMIEVKLQ